MGIPFWRDVSVILLVVEALVLALIPLMVLYVLNRGVWRLRCALRPVFPSVLTRVRQVERATVRLGGLVVVPIVAVYALAARMYAILLSILGLPRKAASR